MDFIFELLIAIHIIIGGIFILVGSFGMLKLPDLMSRLHAPTKATTLGVGGALMASMIFFFYRNQTIFVHEVLITLFLFLTAPVTAHFIAKAHLHLNRDQKSTLPSTNRPKGWSTFDAAGGD